MKPNNKILCFMAGAIGCFALPPFSYWFILLLSTGFLFFTLLSENNTKKAAKLSYLFALGYFIFGLYWIGNATLIEWQTYGWIYPFALLGLPLYLSLFWGLAGYITVRFTPPNSFSRLFLFISAFASAEWLRGWLFTGFPWNLPGYAFHEKLDIAQTVSIFGIYGLTFFVFLWSALIGYAISLRIKKQSPLLAIILITALFLNILAFSHWGQERIDKTPINQNKDVAFLIVQPNIPQKIKWDRNYIYDHIKTLIKLTAYKQSSHKELPKSLYIIWPETAMSSLYFENETVKAAISESLQTWPIENVSLIAGILHAEKSGNEPLYYNSIYQTDGNANLLQRYDKTKLVPFGEYMPPILESFIAPITGFIGFEPGVKTNAFIEDQTRELLYPLICYEAIFPQFQQFDQENAAALITITDDSWYGHTSGPYQHHAIAKFRSIEQGLPLYRASNTGISGAFDSLGKPIGTTIGFNQQATKLYFLSSKQNQKTIYNQYSSMFFVIFILLSVILSMVAKRLKY